MLLKLEETASLRKLTEKQSAGLSLRWDLKICTSIQFPCDADSADIGPHFGNPSPGKVRFFRIAFYIVTRHI